MQSDPDGLHPKRRKYAFSQNVITWVFLLFFFLETRVADDLLMGLNNRVEPSSEAVLPANQDFDVAIYAHKIQLGEPKHTLSLPLPQQKLSL
jgi:hypothetical protein